MGRKCCKVLGALAGGSALVTLIVVLAVVLNRVSTSCPDDMSTRLSLKRDLVPGMFGYDYSIVNDVDMKLATVKRTGLGKVIISPEFVESPIGSLRISMKKGNVGSFLLPNYSLNISGVSGEIGMEILDFVDRYTIKVGDRIFTTKDTWTFKIIPEKFQMVDRSPNYVTETDVVCSLNLVSVSITKTWNICVANRVSSTNPPDNMLYAMIYASAATLAIHDS